MAASSRLVEPTGPARQPEFPAQLQHWQARIARLKQDLETAVVELACDLTHILVPVLECKRGSSRRDFEPAHAREGVDQFLRHRLPETTRGRIDGQVRERKNRNGDADVNAGPRARGLAAVRHWSGAG